MKNKLFQFKKIKSKLLAAFGAVLILSSFLAAWGYYSINNILEIRKVKEDFMTVNEVELKMRKAEKNFLMLDVTNTEFMSSGETKYKAAIDEYKLEQDTIIKRIMDSHWASDLGIKDNLDALHTNISKYAITFDTLVGEYLKRGYEDYGSEGELRAAIQAIENSGSKINMIRLLTLRRIEKDFFLRKDLAYLAQFDEEVAAFEQELGNSRYNEDLRNQLETYKDKFHEVVESEKTIGLNEDSGLLGDLNKYSDKMDPELETIHASIDKQTDQITFNTTMTFIGVFVAQLIIGIFLALMFSKSLTKNILTIRTAALKLAEGVIPQPLKINSTDELGDTQKSVNELIKSLKDSIGVANLVAKGNLHSAKAEATSKLKDGELDKALKNMIAKLTDIVQNITKGANEITLGSSEISKSSQVVAEGATEQASSLEEISASVEQMVSNINQNADNASQAENMTKEAAEKMNTVKSATQSTFDSIKEITEKIEIINVIADKTNLLAINAAVEAARAGEHGKGFAVVANEVRKLAERSQLSAEGIITLSKTCIHEAKNSSELLDQLSPDVLKSFDLVREISSSSAEQRSGAEQINVALSQLNQVTQQNASSSEELSSASHNFNSQAEQLTETVAYFKLNEQEEAKSQKTQIISQIELLKSILGDSYTDVDKEKIEESNKSTEEPSEPKPEDKAGEPTEKGLKIDLSSDDEPVGELGIQLEDFDTDTSPRSNGSSKNEPKESAN